MSGFLSNWLASSRSALHTSAFTAELRAEVRTNGSFDMFDSFIYKNTTELRQLFLPRVRMRYGFP